MAVLECVDTCYECFRCVVGRNFAAELCDDFSSVHFLGNVVDGDSAFLFSGFDYGTVYVHAPHSLASEFWKQRRVEVDDAVFVGLDDAVGDEARESGKHDEVDVAVLQQFQYGLRIASPVGTREYLRRDAEAFHFFKYGCFFTVAKQYIDGNMGGDWIRYDLILRANRLIAVLQETSDVIREHARETDIVARIQAGQYVMVLVHTDKRNAYIMGEKIRTAFEMKNIKRMRRSRASTTLSIGVASFPYDAKDKEGLITAVEKALEFSKNKGGNTTGLLQNNI